MQRVYGTRARSIRGVNGDMNIGYAAVFFWSTKSINPALKTPVANILGAASTRGRIAHNLQASHTFLLNLGHLYTLER